jgi:hypothetical protein
MTPDTNSSRGRRRHGSQKRVVIQFPGMQANQ